MTAMASPEPCSHDEAVVVAVLEGEGEKANVDGPPSDGLLWSRLQNLNPRPVGDLPPTEQLRTSVYLGTCTACRRAVVSVRTWDHDQWSAERGPAWSSRWTALVRDGRHE